MKPFIWISFALTLVLGVAWFALHGGSKPDSNVPVVLIESDPARNEVGALRFLGGIEIALGRADIGGISGLRWRDGKMHGVMDDGRWLRFDLVETDGRLTDISGVETGDLLGASGEPLSGKSSGDAEALTSSPNGAWLVGFERDHRVWAYPRLEAVPNASGLDPLALFGSLEDNGGIETLAADPTQIFTCAERLPAPELPNCYRRTAEGELTAYELSAPAPIDGLGGVPTDADIGSDGTIYVLFRSWSPADGPGAAVIALSPDGAQQTLSVFRPPLAVDNFEGIAVREDEGQTQLYLVSDDNFASNQRTLLLKFEVAREQ